MKIKYLGHSSFLLSGKEKSVVTDPFGDIGYKSERVKADFCTVSHGHYDHSATENVDCGKVVTSSESGFYAIDTFHDPFLGKLRGKNTVFKFKIDGITFCHLGDIGEYASEKLVDEIGETDVLFVPVGGKYTIDHKEAANYVAALKPKVAIPMHFKTPRCEIDIDGVENFAKRAAGVEYVGDEIEIDENFFEDYTKILIMDGGKF